MHGRGWPATHSPQRSPSRSHVPPATHSSIPPRRPQNFLYEVGLQNKPVVLQGISAGAAFAVKLPKAFYEENFGGVIKIKGVLSGTRRRRAACMLARSTGACRSAAKTQQRRGLTAPLLPRSTLLPACRGERDRVEQLDADGQGREVQVSWLAAHGLHLHACE